MSAQVATQAAFARTEANAGGQAVDTFRISNHSSPHSLNGKKPELMNWHHEAMRLAFGGLYPCRDLVQRILAPSEGETKRILDIGCGSKIWCIEMAKEFPEAEVWSVNSLDDHEATYDLIHMRFVAGGCTQFIKTLDDIQACLKPGGLFILIDSTGDLLAEDGVSLLRMKSMKNPVGSRLRRMFFEVHNANCQLGFDENMMFAVLEDGLWEWTDLKHCKAAELLVPIGSWNRPVNNEEKTLRDVGLLMRQSLRIVQPGHESILRSFQFDEAVMNRWKREIDSELQGNTAKISLDVRVLWGRRTPAGHSESREEDTAPTALPHAPPASSWHVYNTAEEWKAMLERRTLVGGGSAENIVPFVQKRMRRPMRRNHS